MANRNKKVTNRTEVPVNVMRDVPDPAVEELIKQSEELLGKAEKTKSYKAVKKTTHKKKSDKPYHNKHYADANGRFSFDQEKELAWINQVGPILGGIFTMIGGCAAAFGAIQDSKNLDRRSQIMRS